jgi:hypothetical protein
MDFNNFYHLPFSAVYAPGEKFSDGRLLRLKGRPLLCSRPSEEYGLEIGAN